MQRIGREPIAIPKGITLSVSGQTVSIKGPKGSLDWSAPAGVTITQKDGAIELARRSESKHDKSCHGMAHRLISNMLLGVSQGFVRELELQGVGYRAQLDGKKLRLELQFSHPIIFEPPPGITLQCPTPTMVIVSGIDKQLVGQVAANLRRFRPPEPYKGKGVRYKGEFVRRKEGKTGTK